MTVLALAREAAWLCHSVSRVGRATDVLVPVEAWFAHERRELTLLLGGYFYFVEGQVANRMSVTKRTSSYIPGIEDVALFRPLASRRCKQRADRVGDGPAVQARVQVVAAVLDYDFGVGHAAQAGRSMQGKPSANMWPSLRPRYRTSVRLRAPDVCLIASPPTSSLPFYQEARLQAASYFVASASRTDLRWVKICPLSLPEEPRAYTVAHGRPSKGGVFHSFSGSGG